MGASSITQGMVLSSPHTPASYTSFGRQLQSNCPLFVPDSLRAHPTLVLGDGGSGKSEFLMSLAIQDLAKERTVLYFDGKVNRDHQDKLFFYAKWTRRSFWDWNLFANMPVAELQDSPVGLVYFGGLATMPLLLKIDQIIWLARQLRGNESTIRKITSIIIDEVPLAGGLSMADIQTGDLLLALSTQSVADLKHGNPEFLRPPMNRVTFKPQDKQTTEWFFHDKLRSGSLDKSNGAMPGRSGQMLYLPPDSDGEPFFLTAPMWPNLDPSLKN
jgi:hypothetical protein